jgi:hypothetical protein
LRAQSADNDNACDSGDRRASEIAENEGRSDYRRDYEQPAEEEIPKAVPERPRLPQNLTRAPMLWRSTTFSSVRYPLPTTQSDFSSKPAGASFFTPASAVA